jgi:hypothetical protein
MSNIRTEPIKLLNFAALWLLLSHFSWDLTGTLEGHTEPSYTRFLGQNWGKTTTGQVHHFEQHDSNWIIY